MHITHGMGGWYIGALLSCCPRLPQGPTSYGSKVMVQWLGSVAIQRLREGRPSGGASPLPT